MEEHKEEVVVQGLGPRAPLMGLSLPRGLVEAGIVDMKQLLPVEPPKQK
jgi:hypothetical protein